MRDEREAAYVDAQASLLEFSASSSGVMVMAYGGFSGVKVGGEKRAIDVAIFSERCV